MGDAGVDADSAAVVVQYGLRKALQTVYSSPGVVKLYSHVLYGRTVSSLVRKYHV